MAEELVSGIIIFYNGERFLRQAIESVLQQTHSIWELLLVDDGSTDHSASIAKEYVGRYPSQVKYLQHESGLNMGMSASRNLGLSAARGEFIAFLDCDDIWPPEKLTEQLEIMRTHDEIAMCYGPTKVWHCWPGNPSPESEDWHTYHGPYVNEVVAPPGLLLLMLNDEFTVPGICSVLVRHSAILALGGFEDEFRGQMEDMVFHTKVLLNAPVFVSNRCWGWYRQHDNNSGKQAMASGLWLPHAPNPARRDYLEWVEGYVKKSARLDKAVAEMVAHQLLPYRLSSESATTVQAPKARNQESSNEQR